MSGYARAPGPPAICRLRAVPRRGRHARDASPARAAGAGKSRDGLAVRLGASGSNQLIRRGKNLRGRIFIGLLRIDDPDSTRFCFRSGEEAVTHPPMKFHHLTFEAIEAMVFSF